MILCVGLYGCEIRFSTLRVEHRLRVLESQSPGVNISTNESGTGGGWRTLRNVGIHDLYPSTNITVIEWWKMIDGTCSTYGRDEKLVYFVGKSERMRSLGRPRRRWDDSLIWILKKQDWRMSIGVVWLRIWSTGDFYESGYENLLP
jgi:hypothetical protein